MKQTRGSTGFIIVFMCCWMACHNRGKEVNPVAHGTAPAVSSRPKDQTIEGNFSAQTRLHFDSSAITRFIQSHPLFKPLQDDIRKFYASKHYAYAWFDNKGMIEQADNLYNHIMNLEAEGLPRNITYPDELEQLFSNPSSPVPENELMLTAQYFNYAKKTWGGISEKQTQSLEWLLPRKKLDLPFLMDSLLRDTVSAIFKNGYSYRQYALLKKYLGRYRDIASKNRWPVIRADKKTFRPGDSSAALIPIRERLFIWGDMPRNSGRPAFDPDLKEGIAHFQRRMGLKADGTIGPETLKQLNTPISKYIRDIIVNMERCRWVPVSLNGDYLVVNIPAFELFAYEKDSLAFTMKVVVGKALHKTVIFNGNLKYIVFSPYWNIPNGIMKKEILPALQKDPDYLRKHNMEWYGKTIRQKPGPDNALGLVKFLFPNSYDIYLHDSPAKSLFRENVRAFSHGCIRIEQPKKLAAYLLRKDPAWTGEKIDKAMKRGREQYVTLKDPVPVFIAYLTAWVDREGQLNIRKDIYHRDGRLASMILNDQLP